MPRSRRRSRCRREQRQGGDERAERSSERLPAGGEGEAGSAEEDGADEVRDPGRARVLERAFAKPGLDELEVGEARETPAAADVRPMTSWSPTTASSHHGPTVTATSARIPTTAWLKRGARASTTDVSTYGSAARSIVRA